MLSFLVSQFGLVGRFVEVSHPIVAGMKTYPGLPEPSAAVLFDYDASVERYQGKAEFFIASLHVCGNTVVLDCSEGERAIGPEALVGVELRYRAVLIRTDFSRFWGTPEYFGPNPFLTAEACDMLVRSGALFVGIDSLNIDDTADPSRPAHTKLLGAGIPICEHMTNLAEVPAAGGRLHAVPIAWVGGASFPVRAYVII
jgi:kynurenine formamidase